jgi:hypothetical protein
MVHELMHHLYQLKNPKTGMQVQIDHARAAQEFSKAIDAYNASSTIANFERVVSRYETRVQSFIKVLINYPMEEMANETELFNLFNTGKLKYVHKESRIYADLYIDSSAKSALGRIAPGVELLKALESELNNFKEQEASPEVKAALSARLTVIGESFESTESDVRTVQAQALRRLKQYGIEVDSNSNAKRSGIVEPEASAPTGCTHSHGVEQNLKDIENKISKLK